MKALLFSLLAAVVLILLILSAVTSLTLAQASLAQATANAFQASANLVTQCITGVMIVVALLAGAALGAGVMALRSAREQNPPQHQPAAGEWLPGPNAYWGHQPLPPALPSMLPPAAGAQFYYPPAAPIRPEWQQIALRESDEAEMPFDGWGF